MDKLRNSLFKKDFPDAEKDASPADRAKTTGILFDYSNIGITPYGIDSESLGAYKSDRKLSIKQDYLIERNPNLNPVAISKGTISSRLGGRTEFRDKTGGTILLTYDPVSGTISIYGGMLVNQTLNLGTLYNSELTGTITNVGTFNMGVATAGTLNNSVINSSYFNNGIIGTPNIQKGAFGTPTIQAGSFSGIQNYLVTSGSAQLASSGNFQLQAYGTSLAIVVNYGGTTFRFLPAGTI